MRDHIQRQPFANNPGHVSERSRIVSHGRLVHVQEVSIERVSA